MRRLMRRRGWGGGEDDRGDDVRVRRDWMDRSALSVFS